MPALLSVLLPVVNGWLERLFPDPAERQKQLDQLLQTLQQYDQAQSDVDKAEAASAALFVAGWRPFIGWVCGGALAYQYLVVPLAVWTGFLLGHPIPKPPVLDDVLWQLMFGMLGMGGLRTFEKIKGVAK
ncbi:MAG TPA: 3TM-type holin [Alphaproteobacteria bacterium]|nr:3TM-type holin [Alphaproteobacteria bacterium]